jgi:hypothetical protein
MSDLIEARREAFEAWHCERFKTEYQTGQPTRDKHNGVYDDYYGPADEQERWLMWNAALDSVVVELPKIEFDDDMNKAEWSAIKSTRRACREAIHAAGIRTKVKE